MSLTGKNAELSAYQHDGYMMWADDVNASGGLLGRPVELIVLDDRGEPGQAREIYTRLMEVEHVDFVMTPYGSDMVEAVLEVSARNGYPLISAGGSADSLWQKGYSNIFGLYMPASRISMPFLEMVSVDGLKGVAIYTEDNRFSLEFGYGARKWAQRLGLTVDVLKTSGHGADYAGFFSDAKEKHAEVLVYAGYMRGAMDFIRALKGSGYRPKAVFCPVGPGAKEFLVGLGSDAEVLFSVTQWDVTRPKDNPGMEELVSRYTKRFGKSPSFFAATAYASGQILHQALKHAGGMDRATVTSALRDMETMSIVGRYGVDRSGVQMKQTGLVVQLQGGRQEVVWPLASRSVKPVYAKD